MKPRILFLVPSDYRALQAKGVDWMIRERDEDGFFERVVTVHPLAFTTQTIDLDAVHRICELDMGRGIGAVFGLVRLFREVVRVARDEQIDLVRATDPYLMGLLAWWIARRLSVPFCISVHADYQGVFELNPKGLAGRVRRRLAAVLPPFVLPRAAMVLPIRSQLITALESAGARRSAIRVIPHGIDTQRWMAPSDIDARRVFDVADGKSVISVACRLSAENYIADIAQVIARLTAARTDVVFVILGEGPEADVLQHLVDTNAAAAAALRRFPFQQADAVKALRQVSDVSLCLMGGFSLIEACAAASPVVAYDVAWHSELIQDRVTGRLVAEHDVAGVVAAIGGILDDRAGAAAMASRAQRLVVARHDLRTTSQLKRGIYAEILGGSDGERASA